MVIVFVLIDFELVNRGGTKSRYLGVVVLLYIVFYVVTLGLLLEVYVRWAKSPVDVVLGDHVTQDLGI